MQSFKPNSTKTYTSVLPKESFDDNNQIVVISTNNYYQEAIGNTTNQVFIDPYLSMPGEPLPLPKKHTRKILIQRCILLFIYLAIFGYALYTILLHLQLIKFLFNINVWYCFYFLVMVDAIMIMFQAYLINVNFIENIYEITMCVLNICIFSATFVNYTLK